jgi:hypothetical protein
MGNGPPHLETVQWRNALSALTGRPMPSRNIQEQLDITMQEKKKLADLAMVCICDFSGLEGSHLHACIQNLRHGFN